jgi:hypothetical protein
LTFKCEQADMNLQRIVDPADAAVRGGEWAP